MIDELGMAVVRTNYGQTPAGVHAFVGGVAMSGAVGGGLWSVKGGNKLVAERALEEAADYFYPYPVTQIKYDEDNYWQVVTFISNKLLDTPFCLSVELISWNFG